MDTIFKTLINERGKNMKYGIMYYKKTDNIGDDIQTYAAIRFLPHIDYHIDREDLNCFIPKEKEYVSMIMNGWFLHNKAAWPPSPYINPLLISMHFTCLEKIDVGEKYLQGLGGDYLKSYQPIGCRDVETRKRLTKNNIENYFSGCMTLTIKPFENIEKQEYICLVDLDERSSKKVKESTSREIREITHDVNPEEIYKKGFEERMKNVEELLKTYQASHLVLTNRLHVALPCIALGTPVILVHKEKFEEDRLGTYLEYMKSFTDVEFEKLNIKDIIDKPEKNSNKYIKIKNSLTEKCEQFIKKCEEQKLPDNDLPEIEKYSEYVEKLRWYKELHEDIRVKAKSNIYESEKRYKEYEDIINNLKNQNSEYNDIINNLKNQNSEYNDIINNLKNQNNEYNDIIKNLKNQNSEYNDIINILKNQNKEYEIEYKKMKEEQEQLKQNNNRIEKENLQIKQELSKTYESKSWKYMQKIKKILKK